MSEKKTPDLEEELYGEEEFTDEEYEDEEDISADEEEDASDDCDEDDEESDDDDIVAMVSRNSERARSGRTAAPTIPVSETDIEIPVRTAPVRTAPQIKYIREPKTANKPDVFGICTAVLSALTLCAVGAAMFFGMRFMNRVNDEIALSSKRLEELEKKNDEGYTEVINIIESEREEAEKEKAEELTLGKGKILLYDSVVGYTWAPIIEGIPLNNYNKDGFSLDDGNRLSYTEDGEVSSYFGIDVSAYQGDIDWDAVRADGIEFAILRVGIRGYGEEGNMKADDYFVKNYDGAHAAGIDVGIYFFSQAITVEEAIEEADFALKLLGGRKLEYPVVFDWEPAVTISADDIPRTEDLMPQTLTLSAIAFCERVREAGYDAMIYTNKKLAVLKYDMRQLSCYPTWLASYNSELTYPYDFDIWQYGVGYVDGIEGEVDFNIAMIK